MTGLVDEELVSHYPDSLKFICHNGAGYDQVDANACAKRGNDLAILSDLRDQSVEYAWGGGGLDRGRGYFPPNRRDPEFQPWHFRASQRELEE